MLPLLLLLASPQVQDQPLALKPDWALGPLMRLELVKGREDWEEDKLVKSSKTVTPIDVEVLAKSESGWIVRWTYGHTSVIEGGGKDKDYAERMASLNEGMRLDVRLALAGVVDGLADPEGLKRHYSRTLQEVERGLLDKGMDKGIVAELMRGTTESVLGPEFEHAALVEVELLHRCFTVPLVPGKKSTFEGELPNPLGGDPFPALGTYQLDPPDTAARQAAAHFTLAIDADKLRTLIQAWIDEEKKNGGKGAPKSLDELPLKRLDETTAYVLDLQNALPRNVEHVRTTLIRKHKRIDRTFLRALPMPVKSEKPR